MNLLTLRRIHVEILADVDGWHICTIPGGHSVAGPYVTFDEANAFIGRPEAYTMFPLSHKEYDYTPAGLLRAAGECRRGARDYWYSDQAPQLASWARRLVFASKDLRERQLSGKGKK
jgi:hypothetical protein